jgi:hypothetical protein
MDDRDAVGDERGAIKGRTGDGVASRRTEEEIATVTDCTLAAVFRKASTE